MKHNVKGTILDRKKGPREAMLKNLATSLVLHEKIQTTEAKAKAVRPLVEQMITVGKAGTVTARRELAKFFSTDNAVSKVMEVLSPRFKERSGGYTRIVMIGHRKGDGAEVAQIEFV